MLRDVLPISETQLLRGLISDRLREIRLDLFGPEGGPEVADLVGVGRAAWAAYEEGVTVPAEVVLAFIDVTGCRPRWLLTGRGEKYERRWAPGEGPRTGGRIAPAQWLPADRPLPPSRLLV
jgi:hypothetical protein